MTEKYLMIDIDDARADLISEILGNKTCKRILEALAEKEMSESDISREMKIPGNTVNYNVKKLVSAGLIEKKDFFWSVKGKKINVYRVSNRKIVISPKRRITGLIAGVIIAGLLALGIKIYSDNKYSNILDAREKLMAAGSSPEAASYSYDASSAAAQESIRIGSETVKIGMQMGEPWMWFIGGAIAVFIIVLAFNWRKAW